MINAFMRGIEAAKQGASVKENPYIDAKQLYIGEIDAKYEAVLWVQGLIFQLEQSK